MPNPFHERSGRTSGRTLIGLTVMVLSLAIAGGFFLGGEAPTLRLKTALRTGNEALVRRIVPDPVPADARFHRGRSLLHLAGLHDRVPILEYLIARGAPVDAGDSAGTTPAMTAAARGNTAVLERLLAAGASLSRRDAQGSTPLMYASRRGHVETSRWLIERGAGVNARTPGGATALMDAALGGHRAVADVLIENGARLNVQDRHRGTPLSRALLGGRVGLAHHLIDRGADPGRFRDSPAVFHAVRRGHQPMTQRLLERGANPDVRWNGVPAAGLAAFRSDTRLLAILLKHGADPDLPSRPPAARAGGTPLMGAAMGGDTPTVDVLLQHGARIHARDSKGMTPLMYAARLGRPGIVRHLLIRGACPARKNTAGETARDLARQRNHARVLDILDGRAPDPSCSARPPSSDTGEARTGRDRP